MMDSETAIFVGKSDAPQELLLRMANRHGLITGATGTGKTITLQGLAEGFSNAGIPVFTADVKGDLAGLAKNGVSKDFLVKRAAEVGLDPYVFDHFPVIFWDLFGDQGHPIRATVSELGPLLLARLMNLNDTQEGVLNIAFRVADDEGLLLLDLKDLQALLTLIAENAADLTTRYGNVAKATVGSIQRQLLVLENQGGNNFFGEPALAMNDMMRVTRDGRGTISVLAADKLMQSPRLYATFLLWLMSELFETLPEVGDLDKPKLVFFFDEAHLLFDEAPDALIQKVEQVVRLIRSRGVGVYFVTQSPIDVPDRVSAQLGNRVQHALRAYTPREQKAVRAAAETFRANPAFKTDAVISELGVGEALVSLLDNQGTPSIVQRTKIRPPSSFIGAITPDERKQFIINSPVAGQYDQPVDRESAYEVLQKRTETTAAPTDTATAGGGGLMDEIGSVLGTIFGTSTPSAGTAKGARSGRPRLTAGQLVARQVARTVANQVAGGMAAKIGRSVGGSVGGSVGRAIVRGTLGSLLRR